MPFISRDSTLKIDHDVSRNEYDPDLKQMVFKKKKFNEPLILTDINQAPRSVKDSKMRQYLFHGDMDDEYLAWNCTPWWRVLTQKMDDVNLWRFYSYYREDMTGRKSQLVKGHQQVMHYVPTYDDFVVSNHGITKKFHLPVWLLDIIIADKLVINGAKMTKDKKGSKDTAVEYFVTQDEVDECMQIYEERKQQEKDPEGVVIDIRKQFKEIKQKESAMNANMARVQQASEKSAEKEYLQASHEAEQALNEAKEAKEELLKEKAEIEQTKKQIEKDKAAIAKDKKAMEDLLKEAKKLQAAK